MTADADTITNTRIILEKGFVLNLYIKEAYKVLDGKSITLEHAYNLGNCNGDEILDLISLANKVNTKYGNKMHICSIVNAKSGKCSLDCKFCAQSNKYNTGIETYPMLKEDEILGQAKKAYNSGVRYFGIVTSGSGYFSINAEFDQIVKAIKKIHIELPDLKVCAGLGILNEITAKALVDAGISHYNINLQTSSDKYSTLVSSNDNVYEKINTIKLLKKYNVNICCGGIIGMGETMNDRVDMAFKLRELDVESIPLNVLVPIKGTPLENIESVEVSEIAKTFAIFRLINPAKIIKFAAGRETRMKDFQGLIMLSGANGFLTGGYLTTRGREVEEDIIFRTELENFRDN
ncbi:MAG: biotin synthase BioB [Candidatus Delongbacteria bacterium]|nr:biotin synthase BioB [Candidatus Delongbacteria bacterium]